MDFLPFKVNSLQFHGGIDLRVNPGTNVYSLRRGYVENSVILSRGLVMENNIRIREVDQNGSLTNRVWSYAHLNGDRVPENIKNSLEKKTILPAGTKLGEVREWLYGPPLPPQIDISDHDYFHHLHLGLLVNGKDCNVMANLDYEDYVSPTIVKIHKTISGQLVLEMFDETDSGMGRGVNPFRLHDFSSIVIRIERHNNIVFKKYIPGIISEQAAKSIFPETILTEEGKFLMEGDVHGRRFLVMILDSQEFMMATGDIIDFVVTDEKSNSSHKRFHY